MHYLQNGLIVSGTIDIKILDCVLKLPRDPGIRCSGIK